MVNLFSKFRRKHKTIPYKVTNFINEYLTDGGKQDINEVLYNITPIDAPSRPEVFIEFIAKNGNTFRVIDNNTRPHLFAVCYYCYTYTGDKTLLFKKQITPKHIKAQYLK